MLNSNLYALLEKRFGSGNVSVLREDQEMVCSYTADPTQSVQEIRYRLVIDEPGEEYMVRCPFCQDWKQRLYINHRWGVMDARTNTRNLWLAHCWNEHCLAKYEKQLLLYDQVVEYYQIGPRMTPQLAMRKSSNNLAVSKPKSTNLPGAIWPLDHMKGRSPRHDAIRYVEDRLWDPVYLGKRFQVGYCIDSQLSMAKHRIVAPVFMDSKLVGWQARFIGDPEKGVPKWYTCPGMHVGRCLYNYDSMKLHKTKVIVEGPADVWSFGPQAGGIFNKSMTSEQRRLLVDCFIPGDVVVILLDPAQDEKSKARGEQHHIEKLYGELTREPKLAGSVLKVYLPHGCDPDELDREYMHEIIRHEASKQKLKVDFGKPHGKSALRSLPA